MEDQKHSLSEKDIELWNAYKAAWWAVRERQYELRQNASNLIEVIRYGLSDLEGPAIELLELLEPEDLKPFLYTVLDGATHQNHAQLVYIDLLLKFPKQWLVDNIEKEAEILLADIGDDEQYWHTLKVFEEIDITLAARHAKKALVHTDPEIKEMGQGFFDKHPRFVDSNEP